MDELWKVAFGIAGIGGIACFVLWSLYKNWLKMDIFQQMTKEQQYRLFQLFFVLSFLFALAGLAVYALIATRGGSHTEVQKILESKHAGIKEELDKESSRSQNPQEYKQFQANVEQKLATIRDAHRKNEDARSRDATKDLLRFIDTDENRKLVPASLRDKIRDDCYVPPGTPKDLITSKAEG